MTKNKFGVMGLLAIMVISIVLRPPVASMGPLLQQIESSLSVSPELIGLLAASPVLY